MALIHEQIPKVMGAVGAIGKDRRNPQQGYQFRGIDDVYNALNSVLAEHGIFTVPTVLDSRREERTTAKGGVLIYTILRVKYEFFASDGSSIAAITEGEGMDSGDKSSNKAMSGAQKYALLQVFAIPTADPKDSEDDSPEVTRRNGATKQHPPASMVTPPSDQPPMQMPADEYAIPPDYDRPPEPPEQQTIGPNPKPMSEAQRRKLWAMMKEHGLDGDQSKAFFNFVGPTTSRSASAFIEGFEQAVKDWKKANQPLTAA